MNFHHNKIGLGSGNKAYLNSSITIANKLNKSRSLLKNSVLICRIKENNNDLARALALKESEMSELRKDNIRLLRENYDLTHYGQFRSYNFHSYMTKFSELTDIAILLFNNVCKLSDDLVEMKSHPFLTCEGYDNDLSIQENDATNAERIPSPFAPKDKIPRSPLNSVDESHEGFYEKLNFLASQIVQVKNKSNNSIHNLSTNNDMSFFQKTNATKQDPQRFPPPLSPLNRDEASTTIKPKITIRRGAYKRVDNVEVLQKRVDNVDIVQKRVDNVDIVQKRVDNVDVVQKRRKKMTEEKDPMFLSKGAHKTKQRKKRTVADKTEKKELNKEEYKKHKEQDAYHLSINETINTTILPPSLNEFKNQQIISDQTELVKENEHLETAKIAEETKPEQEKENIDLSKEEELEEKVVKTKKSNVRKAKEKVKLPPKKSGLTTAVEQKEVIIDGDKRRNKSPNLLLDHKSANYNDDDDDFILSNITNKIKKKNALDDSVMEITDVGDHKHDNANNNINNDKENDVKIVTKKTKSKVMGGAKKKIKEFATVVSEEKPSSEIIVVDKKRKRKNNTDKEENVKIARKLSNVSLIIANINANIEEMPKVIEKVKGRGRKKNNVIE